MNALVFNLRCNKTSDFIVDTLQEWWKELTPQQQQQTHRIQLKIDNGPENSGVRTQFLKRMVAFSYQTVPASVIFKSVKSSPSLL